VKPLISGTWASDHQSVLLAIASIDRTKLIESIVTALRIKQRGKDRRYPRKKRSR
jgi:hypothetical protein